MKESYFQNKLKKELEDKGYLVWVMADAFTSGYPDIYVAKDSKSWWLELKVINAKPGDKTIHLDDRKSSGRGFERVQVIKMFQLNQKDIESYGVAYIPEAKKTIKIDIEEMDKTFTYDELLEFPEFDL